MDNSEKVGYALPYFLELFQSFAEEIVHIMIYGQCVELLK